MRCNLMFLKYIWKGNKEQYYHLFWEILCCPSDLYKVWTISNFKLTQLSRTWDLDWAYQQYIKVIKCLRINTKGWILSLRKSLLLFYISCTYRESITSHYILVQHPWNNVFSVLHSFVRLQIKRFPINPSHMVKSKLNKMIFR